MTTYKLKVQRLLVPVRSSYTSGEVADHTANKDNFRLDEHGRPEVFHLEVTQDQLVYTDSSDYDSLSEEQQEKAVYVFDEGSVKRYVKYDALEEYSPEEEAASEFDPYEGQDEVQKNEPNADQTVTSTATLPPGASPKAQKESDAETQEDTKGKKATSRASNKAAGNDTTK